MTCLEANNGSHIVGNGGNIVICKSGNTSTYELLDISEGLALRDLSPKHPNEKSWEKILQVLIKRIDIFGKDFPNLLETHSKMFEEEAKRIPSVSFESSGDSFHLLIPDNCRIEQVITQKAPIYEGDKRYFINQKLWSNLDERNKAYLVLHELVYRILIDNSLFNQVLFSNDVRYLVSVVVADLLSVRFNAPTFYDFITRKIQFNCIKPLFIDDKITCSESIDSFTASHFFHGKKFEYLHRYVDSGEHKSMRYTYKLITNNKMRIRLECLFNDINSDLPNLEVFADVEVKITKDSIHTVGSAVESVISGKERDYCSLIIRPSKQMFDIIDNHSVLVGGELWVVRK
jgi:hypothetical protein